MQDLYDWWWSLDSDQRECSIISDETRTLHRHRMLFHSNEPLSLLLVPAWRRDQVFHFVFDQAKRQVPTILSFIAHASVSPTLYNLCNLSCWSWVYEFEPFVPVTMTLEHGVYFIHKPRSSNCFQHLIPTTTNRVTPNLYNQYTPTSKAGHSSQLSCLSQRTTH